MNAVERPMPESARFATARFPGRAVNFGPEPRRLFGFHHVPTGEHRVVGIVLCNPFGYDAMCTYRTYRHLAEGLAQAGFHVLRFDYHGTGDSPGVDDAPHRLKGMLGDIHAAVEELKRRAGVTEASLFGVRFGALLAAHVASERDDISSLILFGSLLTGRAYARELRAFHLLKESTAADLQVAGYRVRADFLEELKRLDLLRSNPRRPLRALLVPRDDVAGEERLAEYLSNKGHEVELIATPGYREMMRDVEFSSVPLQVLAAVEAWARAAYGYAPMREQHESIPPPPAPVLIASAGSGGKVSERPVRFGPDTRLFGIVTTPSEGAGAPGEQHAVLFLNVGANHHIGSSRLYVTMSRDLAARGIPCLRFDVSGLGESYAVAGKSENQIYSIACVADVQAALTLLETGLGIRRFVVAGICSGAYLAFHAAAADARIVGQVLMNLSAFEWNEGDTLESRARERFKASHVYGRSLLDRETWRRVLKGQVAAAGIARYLIRQGARVAFAATKAAVNDVVSPNKPLNAIERDFWAISDRGAASLLVYSSDDAALDTLASYLGPGARRMRRRRSFQVQIVNNADHTFTDLSAQRRVAALLSDFVTSSVVR